MSNFGIIALTPIEPRLNQISIAAVRAGAIGVVDVEFANNDFSVDDFLGKLVQDAKGSFGIKCSVAQLERFQSALEIMSKNKQYNPVVILTPGTGGAEDFRSAVDKIHGLGLRAFVEAISLEEALVAESCGVDGIIAKGHESSGRVGSETLFVLLQRFLQKLKSPVWAQGGVGVSTAAACYAAGAVGVVLDSQLMLTTESKLPVETINKLIRMDGGESILVEGPTEESYRIYARPADKNAEKFVTELKNEKDLKRWREVLRQHLCYVGETKQDKYWLLGQDVAFAATLAKQYRCVSGIVQAITQSAVKQTELASQLRLLDENSPLAQAHKTRFPIVQGAMTRVSDTANFANSVASAGALPFLALALMRKEEIEQLLDQCKQQLGEKSWGVGILGFAPELLRKEQMAVITKHKPPFALIAGGRPDQAKLFEDLGITTYLHVPSPLLLKSFIEEGSRHFIFEGKECGGHVGPRSSFILWQQMIDVLMSSVGPREDASKYHILFAGGIHDALSTAMIAAMSAPLAARGMRIGVLMGTAYLFTKEAVQTGAIVDKFQKEAIACNKTVLLETGPGHSIRVIDSPYRKVFDEQRHKLEREGKSRDEVREDLELMNLGRLRIASKGLSRGGAKGLESVSEQKQWEDGMYMIGQVAALRSEPCSMVQLHEDACIGATSYLEKKVSENIVLDSKIATDRSSVEDIAIIGMSCLFPKANDLNAYWQNILEKVDAITEVPKDQWAWENFYSTDPLARDKIASKWGGFLEPITFHPTKYGIPPSSLESIDPMQILILEVTAAALADAGYENRQFPKDRTSVVLANAGHGPITALYSLRSMLDWKLIDLPAAYRRQLEDDLPEWTEDSFAGYLGNVTAGRVANRFDLGGINFSIDAACASSLAALYVAIKELRSNSSDVVMLAATDTHNQPGDYLSFSKTHALSVSGRCRTFDATADGIAISEGVAMLVLKRLSDAQRDGDRIYATIKGIGGSSDGKDLSLTAPRPAGQMMALNRAYDDAGVSPSTVTLIEAHGTGTVAGDKAEIEALKKVFFKHGAKSNQCAVGSVKTNIGHTKAAAGLASLIKVAKSLYHKVQAPTIGVKTPNPACDFPNSPFFINSELRPWINGSEHPRRAGVSAFGFGGTNFHAILEEYAGNERHESVSKNWPTELFVWYAANLSDLQKQLATFTDGLKKKADVKLSVLAYSNYLKHIEGSSAQGVALAVIAQTVEDLQDKLARVLQQLVEKPGSDIKDPRGVYLSHKPVAKDKKVAFLFPGQGSQQVNMLKELCLYFPKVRQIFDQADKILGSELAQPLSTYIFPPPPFAEQDLAKQQESLTVTSVAQPAVGTADVAMFHLLQEFGVTPDMVAGHSYGEYVALYAASVLSLKDLLTISARRGRILAKPQGGVMIAVAADATAIRPLLDRLSGVTLANENSPNQCILSGNKKAMQSAIEMLESKGFVVKKIPVSAAFHSPEMKEVQDELSNMLDQFAFAPPQIAVYSNVTGVIHESAPKKIVAQMKKHALQPVLFMQEVKTMHQHGAWLFVEVGPGAVLSNLVDATLAEVSHMAIPSDRPGKHSVTQVQQMLAQLISQGLELNLAPLYNSRFNPTEELLAVEKAKEQKETAQMLTYLVDSARIAKADLPVISNSGKKPVAQISGKAVASNFVAPNQNQLSSIGKTAGKNPEQKNELSSPSTQGVVGVHQVNDQTKHSKADGNGNGKNAVDVSRRYMSTSAGVRTNGSNVDHVVLQFQQSMLQITNNFLQAQQNVMLAYLQSQNGGKVTIAPDGVSDAMHRSMEMVSNLNADSLTNLDLVKVEVHNNGHEAEQAIGTADPEANKVEIVQKQEEISTDQLIAGLMDIVSQRTGYPPEMLDLNLDLEADLGIDSIKRVEILSSFRKLLPESKLKELEGGVEKLAGTKTLQGIIDWIKAGPSSVAEDPVQAAATDSVQINQASTETLAGEIQRGKITTVELPSSIEGLLSKGIILIAADSQGVAEELQSFLKQKGAQPLLIRNGGYTSKLEDGIYQADFKSVESVTELLSGVKKEHGTPNGLIHLLSLDNKNYDDATDIELQQLPTKSLFVLAKVLGHDLIEKAEQEPTFILAATSLGGAFGYEESKFTYPAFQGGVVGLTKTLAREWVKVKSKVVDFDKDLESTKIAACILSELNGNDQVVEVGYKSGKRIGLEISPAPLNMKERKEPLLDNSSVVLITGGARGITAEAAIELAKRYQPNLVIVGRTPRPESSESSETAALTSPREIKAAIMETMRREGKSVTIPSVETIYQRLMREREIRTNLEKMTKAGSNVRYYSLDVRDEAAFGGLVNSLYETYGNIDGVIHGAGVIEDAYVLDKQSDSFDRVFDTKVLSTLTLSKILKLDSLQFLILFSSVVGRTGNSGQSDYSAANEAINKLALWLDGNCNGHITSIMWGPWRAGMAQPELEAVFAQYGWSMIDPTEGRNVLVAELENGSKGDVEVLLVGQISKSNQGTFNADPNLIKPSGARLHNATVMSSSQGVLEFKLVLDPAFDLYLKDHCLDGIPVLPMAMAVELMAEALIAAYPQWQIDSLENLDIPSGIVFDSGTREVTILLKEELANQDSCRVAVSVATGKTYRNHFRAIAKLTKQRSQNFETPGRIPTSYSEIAFKDAETTLPTVANVYTDWMFHGPIFQGVEDIFTMGIDGISGAVVASDPVNCLKQNNGEKWIVDPVLLDSAMQLAGIWARHYLDITVLPTGFKKMRFVKPLSGTKYKGIIYVPESNADGSLVCHLAIYNEDKQMVLFIEGLSGIGSKSFNRLVGQPRELRSVR